jgi:putative transcriptional regulator
MVALAIMVACGGVAAAAEMLANSVFLVARSEMRDPNFQQTVVLVTHPRRGGPWGVIINRPLNLRLAEILPEYESLKGRNDLVYFGGPVERTGLVFMVRSSKPVAGASALLNDVYALSNPDAVDALLRRPGSIQVMRVYAGYAGWAPGQLQAEIAGGGWHILPADAETIFQKDAAAIWPELIERASGRQARYPIRD